ncbi:hypothetical protein AKJ37_00565 [candidate division MSBL1 archaeon SCGC-AAA259I09]|uniref:DDE domain-containing protein n=1 Tax=candidate division MSBL1 archaeon SCGC-AAA259I09 TaxID=1698267 RepID=A0A133UVU5_9EURY|nr:hypothetical protein AKJ37_00565 [candidate division MSBL1 archaeon SCGC-AAA259I09]
MECFDEKFFDRNQVTPEVKAFGAYLYVSQGSSYRKVARLLETFGIRVSHVAVWQWVQRLGETLGDEAFREKERKILIADETKIKCEKGWIYVFAGIDPENREIVNFHVTEHRESIDTLIFLKKCLKYCKNKPELITDGGSWYPWPAQRLGLNHHVVSGEERNYVERWYQTLKRRLQNFYTYFPTSCKRSIRNFMTVYAHWYNNSRHHMTLKKPPNQKTHGIKTWIKTLT